MSNIMGLKKEVSNAFTIPCTTEMFKFAKALCDLSESINLMPFAIFWKLGLGTLNLTTMRLLMLVFFNQETNWGIIWCVGKSLPVYLFSRLCFPRFCNWSWSPYHYWYTIFSHRKCVSWYWVWGDKILGE